MRQERVMLVDDVDGGEAAETVGFQLDGRAYEIDLSGVNAEKLRGVLAPYVAAARKVGSKRGPVNSAQKRASDRERNRAIREWARGKGYQVGDRGRIPDDIQIRYDNAS